MLCLEIIDFQALHLILFFWTLATAWLTTRTFSLATIFIELWRNLFLSPDVMPIYFLYFSFSLPFPFSLSFFLYFISNVIFWVSNPFIFIASLFICQVEVGNVTFIYKLSQNAITNGMQHRNITKYKKKTGKVNIKREYFTLYGWWLTHVQRHRWKDEEEKFSALIYSWFYGNCRVFASLKGYNVSFECITTLKAFLCCSTEG